jgi:hypothetical protein
MSKYYTYNGKPYNTEKELNEAMKREKARKIKT